MKNAHLVHLGILAAAGSVVAMWIAACGPAAGGDPEYWAPRYGAAGGASSTTTITTTDPSTGGSMSTTTTMPPTGGAGGGGSGGGGGGTTSSSSTGGIPTGPTAGDLTVSFTTVSFGGKYSPNNVVAVWIADDQNTFVKTLGVFATKRIKYLVTWLAASGGNTVDAVTSATFAAHGPHTVKWDSTGVDGKVVPDGNYRVYIEFTEQNKLGKFTFVPFAKGPTPATVSPPDEPFFKDIQVVYAP